MVYSEKCMPYIYVDGLSIFFIFLDNFRCFQTKLLIFLSQLLVKMMCLLKIVPLNELITSNCLQRGRLLKFRYRLNCSIFYNTVTLKAFTKVLWTH